MLERHGHRRSPRPEHRHLAISKSAHCTAGLRRIVYGTHCAVSSNRSLSIASSSSRAATARQRGPKRLFGSVGGRPACAMVRKRKAPEAERRALPPHSSRSGGSPRRRSSTHQTTGFAPHNGESLQIGWSRDLRRDAGQRRGCAVSGRSIDLCRGSRLEPQQSPTMVYSSSASSRFAACRSAVPNPSVNR